MKKFVPSIHLVEGGYLSAGKTLPANSNASTVMTGFQFFTKTRVSVLSGKSGSRTTPSDKMISMQKLPAKSITRSSFFRETSASSRLSGIGPKTFIIAVERVLFPRRWIEAVESSLRKASPAIGPSTSHLRDTRRSLDSSVIQSRVLETYGSAFQAR